MFFSDIGKKNLKPNKKNEALHSKGLEQQQLADLHQNIKELNHVMKDINTMTNEQGELICQVADDNGFAKSDLESGNQQLKKAKKLNCCCC